MKIKEAMRQVRIKMNRYEREGWELFSYFHKEFMYSSEEWKVVKTSKSKEANLLISSVVTRLNKLENKLYEEQQKSIKERENIISGIEVIKKCLNDMNVNTEKTDYSRKSNKELMDILDGVCKVRNDLISLQQTKN